MEDTTDNRRSGEPSVLGSTHSSLTGKSSPPSSSRYQTVKPPMNNNQDDGRDAESVIMRLKKDLSDVSNRNEELEMQLKYRMVRMEDYINMLYRRTDICTA
eukprot:GHVQ01014311.1.p1 GENE.GHVQ01014311.1~~GHVQ01014311.1.p1  ORF type:complete len:101 (+),score=19.10 GHVQ01014311.1:174-476(+)